MYGNLQVISLIAITLAVLFHSTSSFHHNPSTSSINRVRDTAHDVNGRTIFHRRGSLSMLLNSKVDVATKASALDVSTTPTPVISQTAVSSVSTATPYDLSPQQFVYVVLTSVFITCLIVADVIGVKLFEIPLPFEILGHKTVEHTCGMLTFPITFILGDIINEYYGAKAAKRTVYIGLAMSALVFVVMNLAQALPYLDKPFNVSKDSFDAIFGSAKLMYVASCVAYLIGSLSDIWLFGVIKKVTKGKLLWLRATGSTVISQVLDSFVVSYIAFSVGKALNGQTPATLPEVLNIAATGYGLKFLIAASLTPLLYVLKSVLTERFGLQALPYDPAAEGGDEKL